MTDSIAVRFVGNHQVNWDPSVKPSAGAAGHNPSVDPRFIEYLRGRLKQRPPDQSSATWANQKKWLLATINIALDPSSKMFGVSADGPGFRQPGETDMEYGILFDAFMVRLSTITATWLTSRGAKGPPRDAADTRAQKNVPKMYRERCLLTGTARPQGAHIIPVRSKAADHSRTWYLLRTFWPSLPAVQSLTLHGREEENVLPLTHTAHDLWDAFLLGIRPVAHPTDPTHRIFVQVVWLRDPDGGRVESRWDFARFGGISDYRRPPSGSDAFPAVQHGDVYEIVTDNPAAAPLPSWHFLNIQYHLHRIMAGIQAAGALRTIFSDPPPGDDEDDDAAGAVVGDNDDSDVDMQDVQNALDSKLDEDGVPWEWKPLLEAAVAADVLDDAAAALWARAFARKVRAEVWANCRTLAEMRRLEARDAAKDDGAARPSTSAQDP